MNRVMQVLAINLDVPLQLEILLSADYYFGRDKRGSPEMVKVGA